MTRVSSHFTGFLVPSEEPSSSCKRLPTISCKRDVFPFSTKTRSVSTGFSVRSQIGLGFDWVGLEDSARFFFLRQMNYEGSTHPMSRLREDAKKGAAKNREPHANVLKTGRTQNASARQQSTSAREDSKRNGSLAWTSEFNAPRTVMLRTMSFVMTPPAVFAPMSKRVRSSSSRPSNRVSALPGERATKPTWEVRARGAEQPA